MYFQKQNQHGFGKDIRPTVRNSTAARNSAVKYCPNFYLLDYCNLELPFCYFH